MLSRFLTASVSPSALTLCVVLGTVDVAHAETVVAPTTDVAPPNDPSQKPPEEALRVPAITTTAPVAERVWMGPGSLPAVSYPTTAARFGLTDLILTTVGGGAALTAAIMGPNRDQPTRGPLPFDEDIRNALRPDSFRLQLAAKDVSDIFLGFSLSYAFFGDGLVNAAWLRQSPDAARQIALLNAEVVAVTMGIQQLTANLVSRERPYGRTCGTDFLDDRTAPCVVNDRYLSHFSGHASVTFAMAAATCVHAHRIPLAGDSPYLPCLGMFLNATLTAGLRVVGDQHYATDVLMGAFIGSSVGFLIPTLHYGFVSPDPSTSILTEVHVTPTPSGILVGGTF